MTLGISGGDYVYQNYLSSYARDNTGFLTGGSVTSSGGLVLYASSGTYCTNDRYLESSGAYLTLDAGSTVPRMDLIYLSGTAYSTRVGTYPNLNEKPNPPQLLAHEISVAHVTVASGASALTNANVRDTKISLTTARAPVGSIIAWHKFLANTPALPSGWVECNGQVLSDADSVYNGATIPDLNGNGAGNNRFLRGSATSGAVIDTSTHVHGYDKYNNASHPYTDTAYLWDVPSFNVVWIMRVK